MRKDRLQLRRRPLGRNQGHPRGSLRRLERWGLTGPSTKDGSVIWKLDTNREFEIVNGVPAKGGSSRIRRGQRTSAQGAPRVWNRRPQVRRSVRSPSAPHSRHQVSPKRSQFVPGVVLGSRPLVEQHRLPPGHRVRWPLGQSGVVGVSGPCERHPRTGYLIGEHLHLRALAGDRLREVVGMNRFLPAVFAPYGIPLNTLIPSTAAPRTLPAVVSTLAPAAGPVVFACWNEAALALFGAKGRMAPACAPATSRDARLRKARRPDVVLAIAYLRLCVLRCPQLLRSRVLVGTWVRATSHVLTHFCDPCSLAFSASASRAPRRMPPRA
jgi:hypothetical protein